jgi:hypothetical protein
LDEGPVEGLYVVVKTQAYTVVSFDPRVQALQDGMYPAASVISIIMF